MKIVESIYVAGKPVGRLIVNTNSREINFHPAEAPSPLPDKEWSSTDELRQAVTQAYTSESPVVAGLPIFTDNINLNHPKEVSTDA